MNPPKNILVPVDFSEVSTHALDYAQTVAKALGASVHVLHVLLDLRSQDWSVELPEMALGGLLESCQTYAQQRLDALAVDAPGERVVAIGQPFSEIIRYAESHGVDLIVMGTHGLGAIEHMLLGSVAEKVVRKAPCPVLTVREPVGAG